MNATYFFTDFSRQQAEYAQLKFLTKNNRSKSCGFIGLYGNASAAAAISDSQGAHADIWETLSAFQDVYVCPSAAARRGIDTSQINPPRAGMRWLSLPAMLERIAPNDGEPITMSVCLSTDSDLARTEALELCLGALAMDFTVQLSLRGAGILGLQQAKLNASSKGYASLSMYGLAPALIAAKELSALAPLTLSPESLSLPWQLGEANNMALMFEF